MGTRLALAAMGLYVIAVWAVAGFAVYSWLDGPATAHRPETPALSSTASTCAAKCTAFPERREASADSRPGVDLVSSNDARRVSEQPL